MSASRIFTLFANTENTEETTKLPKPVEKCTTNTVKRAVSPLSISTPRYPATRFSTKDDSPVFDLIAPPSSPTIICRG
jgi:hypothetical protein